MKKMRLLGLLLIVISLSACRHKNQTQYNDFSIQRYDKALFSINKQDMGFELKRLYIDYAFFLDSTKFDNELYRLQLLNFIEDPVLIKVAQDVNKKYPDLKFLERQLAKAFSIYAEKTGQPVNYPSTYTYISSFDYAYRVLFEQNTLLIGLDMYLGENSPYYQSQGIPKYLSQKFDKQYIAPDAMRAFVNVQMKPHTFSTLLDHIVYQGKIMFFLSTVLPDTEEYLLAGFSKEQWVWCEKNEALVWKYFIQNNLLFEQDYFQIKNFINDGPTTPVFPGSPSRITSYIGYKIIKKYVDINNISLLQLMDSTKALDILQQSKYKP